MAASTRSYTIHPTLPNATHTLKFNTNPVIDQYKIFEVSEDILDEIECCYNTDILQIKGELSDEAVLVTHNNTYLIRCAETSNTIILAEYQDGCHDNSHNENDHQSNNKKLKFDDNTDNTNNKQHHQLLHGFITKHYELEVIQPKLSRLRDILYSSIYYMNDNHHVNTTNKYTTSDLLKIIQCSSTQLHNSLIELGGLCIHSYWHILNPDDQAKIYDSILDAILQSRMNIHQIDQQIIINTLYDIYTAELVQHVLQQYTVADDKTNTLSLNISKTCIFKAVQLFLQRDPYPHNEFITEWINSLPHSIVPDINMLAGVAIYEPMPYNIDSINTNIKRSSTTLNTSIELSAMQWRYFPVTSLSTNIRDRFNQLFTMKQKWTLHEITPYINDICSSTMTIEKFVMKNCRAMNDTINGNKTIVYMKK